MDVDSDHLHFSAIMARCAGTWFEVFPGIGMSYAGSRDLVLEVMPVELPDEYPDDGDQADEPDELRAVADGR